MVALELIQSNRQLVHNKLDSTNDMLKRLIYLGFILVLTGCYSQASEPVVTLSLSSDGHYAVSVHRDKKLVLWDIPKHKANVISKNANLYSAYFVKGRNIFAWQDLENVVHIQDTTGKLIQSVTLPFPVYGQVLAADLKTYFASDIDWNIFAGLTEHPVPVKQDGPSPSFKGIGKLLNLMIAENKDMLLSVGDGGLAWPDPFRPTERPPVNKSSLSSDYAGVVLWNSHTLQPYAKLPGNAAKTYATFSPDGKYVVSGSENGIGFVWKLGIEKPLFDLASLFHGIPIDRTKEKWEWSKKDLISPPPSFGHEAILSIKFISTDNHYLRISTYEPYAILYEINNPLPLKYLALGTLPFPAVSDYSRNAAIDSAPEAGILVTGQRDGNGINVYKYDKVKQTLDRIWVTH